MIQVPRLVVVVSGPSGAGKSTLCDQFVASRPTCSLIVTSTTRPIRHGEKHGEDYNFISDAEFQRMVGQEEFLEHARVHDYCYGSPRKVVDETLAEGKDVILEIDVQGGQEVKRRKADALLVFVIPSDLSVLRHRLMGRGTDTPEIIEKRLSNARREMEKLNEYDYVVFNDDLGQAVQLLGNIIDAERHRVNRYDTRQVFNPELLSRAL
jgi:guanylate kinase